MDKIKPKVADVGLPRQLDMCVVVICRLLKLQKCIWYYLNWCGNLRKRYTSFMKKLGANKVWILEETDHEDKDVILSLQYNVSAMLWRFW